MKKGFIKVEFKKNYCASRGPAIAGLKGDVKEFRKSDALTELLNSGVVEATKKTAGDRKKATGKKGAEKS